jgi:hypothetical protein
MSFQSLAVYYTVGKSTVNRIVSETCAAIWSISQLIYMPVPCEDYWLEESAKHFERTYFPNCIGSMDGKHCCIKCPSKAGSLFYNSIP